MAHRLFSKRVAATASLMAGVLAIALGLVSVGGYVVGVIDVWGEPDRSWIFWGLVFLFGGLILIQAGVAAIILGRALRRREEDGTVREEGGTVAEGSGGQPPA